MVIDNAALGVSAALVPAEITQGTTQSWDVVLSDYVPSEWTLSYTFFSDRQRVSATCTPTASGWNVTLSKTTTAGMYPGVFAWQAFVLNLTGTIRHNVATGATYVLPDLSVDQTPPHDPRTHAQRMLDQYSAMMLNEAFIKTLLPEQIEALERVRKQFEWDVKRQKDAEKLRAGGYPTRKIFARMSPI